MLIPQPTFTQSAIRKWVKSQKISPSHAALRLRELLHNFELVGDRIRADRCRDLLEKADAAEFVIAFCGHFSAGKSTMINELMGEELLPTNPIPTSANVVKVKTGPAHAVVTFKEKGEVAFPYPYDVKEIQAYCTDGDRVDRVEIAHPNDQLPPGVAILDTPGIDSTEDAHRVAAESLLHTADLILYMTDYNHVQSRLNSEFIEALQQDMKPTWLLINQIDKHVAFEVQFTEFARKITNAFTALGVQEDEIFFTTVREPDHPHNDVPQLKQRLAEAIAEKRRRVTETVLTAAYLLVRDHLLWREEKRRAEIEAHRAVLGTYSMTDGERIVRELADVKEREQALTDEAERFEREFAAKLDRLFKNANLMPYHTRELARSFVESQQVSFRVGRLFSGHRTKEERERRLTLFHKEVRENAATYIDIHLKKMMLEHLETYGIENEQLRRSIYEMEVPITKEMLVGTVNRGALFSTEYIVRYASFVVDAVRQLYTQAVKEKMEEALLDLKKNRRKKADTLSRRREELEKKRAAVLELQEIAAGQQRALRQLLDTLGGSEEEFSVEEMEEESPCAFRDIGEEKRTVRQVPRVHIGRKQAKRRRPRQVTAGDMRKQARPAIEALEQSACQLQVFPGFRGMVQELVSRAQRMKRQQYTIALFGAFSAGKSSFANALLGDAVLPVSPHPTTAAINHVLPPTEERPHGTVLVQFKRKEQVLADVNQALEIAEQKVASFAGLEALLDEHARIVREQQEKEAEKARREALEQTNPDAGKKTERKEEDEEEEEIRDPLELLRDEQLFFLEAVRNGLSDMRGQFGEERTVTMEELSLFVAVEERACFVERVLLYYDGPLTRQGVILIDTPGAGSMNARHTEVAFEHIKHADAVVFVTYYNHAFSRADREFLIQLGRVKEYFARDKMFFIVNAADLAASEAEIDDVLRHVERNLLACGIREARLYPVSSQIGLLAARLAQGRLSEDEAALYRKLTGTPPDTPPPESAEGRFFSGITLFEEDFRAFVTEELVGAAVASAYEDIGRALRVLEAWRTEARTEEGERRRKEEQAKAARLASGTAIEEVDTDIERGLVAQEIEELVYYVKQRVFYRYFDEFKAIINVPAFADEQEEMQTLLRRYTNEIIRFVAFDLAQEMRATSLRIETFLERTLAGIHRRTENELRALDENIALAGYEALEYETPSFVPGLHEWNATVFADLLAPYKNRATFFTEGGNMKLRDDLEARLRGPVSEYVSACEKQLKDAYLPMFDREVQRLRQKWVRQVDEYFTGKLAALTASGDMAALDAAYEAVRAIYQTRRK